MTGDQDRLEWLVEHSAIVSKATRVIERRTQKTETVWTVSWESFDGSDIAQGVDSGRSTYREAIDSAIADEKSLKDNYDPTPWCSICGSKTKAGCNCPPAAANE